MKILRQIGLVLAACLVSFGATAYTQPLGGSIFPLTYLSQPPLSLTDSYNQMLGLINAQVVAASGGIASDLITGGDQQATATLTATSSTTFASVAGLTQNVTGTGVYNFRMHLVGTAGASGGLKVAFAGTATATAFNSTCWNYNGTTINAVTNVTSLASSLTAQTAVYTDLVCEGSITVNAGGTLIVQAAQNASNATSTTVLTGSQMAVRRVS